MSPAVKGKTVALKIRVVFCVMIMLATALAGATSPPPAQLTADCTSPTYASDVLICEDAGLRELDKSLALRIERRDQAMASPGGNESDLEWFRRSRLCAFETDQRECLVSAYCMRLAHFDRSDWINHAECSEPLPGYVAAASVSKSGFVSDEARLRELLGGEIGMFGFVDHQNLYGDEDARRILGDWWAGYGPDSTTWQFKLKANENDSAGQSFTVRVQNDMLRDDLLRLFVLDAEAGRPTPVHLTGIISTFPAPANHKTLLGLSMELESTWDIHLGPRPAP